MMPGAATPTPTTVAVAGLGAQLVDQLDDLADVDSAVDPPGRGAQRVHHVQVLGHESRLDRRAADVDGRDEPVHVTAFAGSRGFTLHHVDRYERLSTLLDLLGQRGKVDVDDLAEELDVSAATIRRDLDHLADQQLLTRTRGGAVANNVAYDLPLRYKTARHASEKERIGARRGGARRAGQRGRPERRHDDHGGRAGAGACARS